MTRRAWRSVILLLLLQGAAVLVYLRIKEGRVAQKQAQFHYERAVSAPALPPVELSRLDGSTLHTSTLLGHPVLLHFWATWCPPCKEELPGLLQLAREEPELRVLALSLDEDWLVVQQFFGGTVPAEIVRDPSSSLVKMYEVGTLPDTYLFDHAGNAALRFGGARDWKSDSARNALIPVRAPR